MTAAEVLKQFKEAGGKGPLPGLGAAELLAHAINCGEEFVGLMSYYLGDRVTREQHKHWKNGPSAKLRKVLIASCKVALDDARMSGRLALLPPFDPEYDQSPYTHRAAAMIAVAKAVQDALEALAQTEPLASSKPPGPEWHDDARHLAAKICDAYKAAGRGRVSFGKRTAPAIHVLVWALGKKGHVQQPDAIVAALRRSRAKV